jgi:hypothetical protein
MRRSLVESLDENIRDLSGTPSPSKNALVYCLQAISDTDKKVRIMKSHIAEMEEEIDRVPVLRNKLLANDLESKSGETDNSPSRDHLHQTTLSQSVFLRYPRRTPNPTRNDVFKLDRTEKQVLKLPQSSRNNDIKLDHHHNTTKKDLTKIIARRKRINQDGDENEKFL